MTFVFDLDDTICDTDAYSEQYIRQYFAHHNMPYRQIATNTRFAESKFDWPRDVALEWYKQYGDQMMLEFPCKPGVIDTINTLHAAGHKIIIATARATDWHTEPEKITLQWLANNNVYYDKIYIGRVDKEKVCEEENADVFVDDDVDITSKVAQYFGGKVGKYTYIANTPYNASLPIAPGVNRLMQFSHLLKLK